MNQSKPNLNISPQELAKLNETDLIALGTELDGVKIIHREPRWAQPGTKAEKRAERTLTLWFILSGILALTSLLVFFFWPHEYAAKSDPNYFWYSFFTPVLGITFGGAILCFAVGIIGFIKKFIPTEIAVQERHDGGSTEVDKKTTSALLSDALTSSTLPRRKMLSRSAIFGIGTIGISGLIGFLGGLIKNPWAKKDKSELHHTGWSPIYNTNPKETIFLRRDTGNPFEVALVKPDDLDAGGMETVFPWRVSDGYGETEESREKLLKGLRGVRNPVMLIRLRSEDAKKVIKRKGQENFNYGDYYAYTKICSHLGCPTSLYEQQTNRILCPCHQSQFDALQYGKAIFGPAARALAQLPITVNNEGYFIAAGDFIEDVGPAFWERRP